MRAYNRDTVAKRLRELRKKRGWTQTEMGNELNKIVGVNALNLMVLDDEKGKATVSQLESITRTKDGKERRGLTQNLAFAYAEIFDVSIDYLYGRTDDLKPYYRDVKELTGLSDDAVKTLCTVNEVEKNGYHLQQGMEFINAFLSMKVANSLFRPVEAYRKCVEFCAFLEKHYSNIDFSKEVYSSNRLMKLYYEGLIREGEIVDSSMFDELDKKIDEDDKKNKILKKYHEHKNKIPYLLFDVQQSFISFITTYGIANFDYGKYCKEDNINA